MSCKFTEIQCREVICIESGRRLGFVSDVLIELPDGHIIAIVVPGPAKLMGLVDCREDYIIPWNCIRRMGPDIILVETKPEDCRVPRPRPFRGKS